jgi:sugar phosphate permease
LGWRMTYVVLGIALLLIMVPVALILYRARPETYGLLPDGAQTPKIGTSKGEVGEENWTAREASRTAAFWIIALGLASISMLSTGLQFHMVRIFLDSQLSADAAARVYLPIAMTTAVVTLGSGILIDRIGARYLLMSALLFQVAALWMAPSLNGIMIATTYGVVLGCLSGLQRTVSTVVYASYFGRLHLGAISGISSTILVASSALGPLPMALARDLLGEYNQTLYLLSILPMTLAVVSLFMRRPRKEP